MKLGIVSTHFNPCGFETRNRNQQGFRAFMDSAGVDHLTVELVFDPEGPSAFSPGSTNLLTVRGGDVMWQKERLAAIGAHHLFDAGFTHVAVADGDISFAPDDWFDRIRARLETHDVVQCFETAVRHFVDGRYELSTELRSDVPANQRHPGCIWAMSRAFFEQAGLYEHAIIGGGDRLMSLAWTQFWRAPLETWRRNIAHVAERRSFTPGASRHYEDWMRRGHEANPEWRIGYVPGVTVHSAPHGRRSDRHYNVRHAISAQFDPTTDIRPGPGGAFVWNTDKPRLHQALVTYFESRREDG